MRKDLLKREPLCRMCSAKGIVEAATECDHIKAVRFGGEILDPDNLQPLCSSCHREKSNREHAPDERVMESKRILDSLNEFDDWGSETMTARMKELLAEQTHSVNKTIHRRGLR